MRSSNREILASPATERIDVRANRIPPLSNDTVLEVRKVVSEPIMNGAVSAAKGLPVTDPILDLGGPLGLSESDACARLQQEGPNELPTQTKRNLFAIVLGLLGSRCF